MYLSGMVSNEPSKDNHENEDEENIGQTRLKLFVTDSTRISSE